MRRSDAIIYAIGVQDAPAAQMGGRGVIFLPPESVTDDRFLAVLAREGGGRLLHAQQQRTIERTFARVFEEFNQRYVLGFAPRGVSQAGWHKVDVRLKNKRGTVLARRGYFGS